jgi:hypothetical protein
MTRSNLAVPPLALCAATVLWSLVAVSCAPPAAAPPSVLQIFVTGGFGGRRSECSELRLQLRRLKGGGGLAPEPQ